MLTGKHFIAGNWVAGDAVFLSTPVSGEGREYAVGTSAHIDQAVTAAEQAFETFGWMSAAKRAAFIRQIATEIDARGAEITEIGTQETGLPAARLEGERGRTVGQLKLFADHIEKGDYLDRRHDQALPDRQPLPRPDLRLQQRPLGPVAVFGASNFPLAFSVAGGIRPLHWQLGVRLLSRVMGRIQVPGKLSHKRLQPQSKPVICPKVSFP